jgi:hypothetical protein
MLVVNVTDGNSPAQVAEAVSSMAHNTYAFASNRVSHHSLHSIIIIRDHVIGTTPVIKYVVRECVLQAQVILLPKD